MELRFTRSNDGEPSDDYKRRKVESSAAGRRETLFRPLLETQTSPYDHGTSSNQTMPAELDLELRLAPPQTDAAGPCDPVTRDFLPQLDKVPWKQAMQTQRPAVHDQAGPSEQGESSKKQQTAEQKRDEAILKAAAIADYKRGINYYSYKKHQNQEMWDNNDYNIEQEYSRKVENILYAYKHSKAK